MEERPFSLDSFGRIVADDVVVVGEILVGVAEAGFGVLGVRRGVRRGVRSGVRVDIVRGVVIDLRLEERSFGAGAVDLVIGVLEASLLAL